MKVLLKDLFPIVMAASCAFSAAGAVVKGRVSDTEGEALTGTSITLRHLPDSARAGFAVADVNGDFSISKIKPGRYSLLASMLGMDDVKKEFTVSDTTKTLSLGTIVMRENSVMLKETVVTGVRAAVVAKEDTLEFNAGSYHTNPNASVEDLMKKLPGVEVGSDGTIKSGGKTVSKILVNGKEFFADDPQLATKNLPSNMVEKVQVIDRKSDLARLTGVDDGEDETVINLTVKKNMNQGWFGDILGGYGTDGRYQGSFNVNWFDNGNQLTILGGANNINELGFGDKGRGRFRDFGGNGGINTSQRFGINFNVGNDEKFRVGGNVFYSHSDRDSRQSKETMYLFPDSTSYQSGGSRTRDKGHNLRADFRMKWNIDDYNVIDFRPRFSFNWRDSYLNDSSLLRAGDPQLTQVNRNRSRRNNDGTSLEASGDLIYNHKFASRPGRSFSVQMKYSFSDTRQHSITWSDIEYFLRQDESETLYRYLDSREWSNTLEGRLSWTEPLGDPSRGNFLTFAYKAQYRFNNADKMTYDLPDAPTGENPVISNPGGVPADAVFSDLLSNSFRNEYATHELQAGFKRTTSKYNLDAGLLFAPSSMKSEDLINSARNIPRRYVWNVAPYMRFRWKFSKTSGLRVNYRARTSQPSMSQLQPVPDVSDPLHITVGNPDLKPTFTQSLNFHFNDFDMDSQRSIFAVFNASAAINTIVSRTTTDAETGSRTTTYANADGNWNVFGMFMINQPFTNRSWRFNARLHARYANSPGYINGDFNRSGDLSLSPSAGVTFSSDIFQFTLNPTYSFSLATSSLAMQKDRTTHSYGADANVELYLPFGLNVSSDLSFSKTTGLSAGYNTAQWLWNAQLSYSTLRDKSLTFAVRAFDLLGQKKNISRSVTANLISDSRYNDLTRYVMFTVSWKFNTLKKKTQRTPEAEGFGDHPGPPPGERPQGESHMGPPPGGFGGGFGPR